MMDFFELGTKENYKGVENNSFENLGTCLRQYLASQADPFYQSERLVRIIWEACANELEKKRIESLDLGLLPQVLAVTAKTRDPMELSKEQAVKMSQYCISSSNMAKFRPFTGRGWKQTNVEDLAERMQRSKKGGGLIKTDKEKDFFKCKHDELGSLKLIRNIETWTNPCLPHLLATPDGFAKENSNSSKIYAVVEVKTTEASMTRAEFIHLTKSSETYGVRYPLDAQGRHVAELRPGHWWSSQLICQCLVMRVRKGILAVSHTDGWTVITIDLVEDEINNIVNNVKTTYREVMLHISEKNKILTKIMAKSAGRPKKKVKNGSSRNFRSEAGSCQASSLLTGTQENCQSVLEMDESNEEEERD